MKKILGILPHSIGGRLTTLSILDGFRLNGFEIVIFDELKNDDFWIVGTDMNGEDYCKIDYKRSICLVIGNEGKGISKVVKNECDYIATISMVGNIDSLNASVSCGIILAKILEVRSNE